MFIGTPIYMGDNAVNLPDYYLLILDLKVLSYSWEEYTNFERDGKLFGKEEGREIVMTRKVFGKVFGNVKMGERRLGAEEGYREG